MRLRHACPSDYDRVPAVVDEWWSGRSMSARLSHVSFTQFATTSFVLETDAELVGFLLGFLSHTHPDEAYAHVVGVHPGFRRLRLGRRLYGRFFVAAQMQGRRWVRSITARADVKPRSRRAAQPRGRWMRNVLPSPTTLSTDTLPP